MFDVFYSGQKPGLFAHERKADSIEHAQKLSSTRYFWWVNYLYDYTDWDWLFEPVPWQAEYTHVWPSQWDGVFGACLVPTQAQTLQYYHHTALVPVRPHEQNYTTLVDCEFDYSWMPHPWEPPFIYVFGNQHWSGTVMPTVTYTVPGATQQKFLDWPIAQLPQSKHNWQECEDIDQSEWDWSWVPNPKDPPYVYAWGNQWHPPQHKVSVKYMVPGATEVKYMPGRTCRLPQPSLFQHKLTVDNFDHSWEPNPFDPPLIYVFGNQWNRAVLEPTVIYAVPGAVETKYIDRIKATVAAAPDNFELLDDIEDFDYSWRPNPKDPPYIYVFGNQWLSPEQRPALQYRAAGAVHIKYMNHPKAQRKSNPDKFLKHYNCEFDWSWEPDPGDPALIYVFGNQWWSAEIMPTVEYHTPGATQRKFMHYPTAKLFSDQSNWTQLCRQDIEFDFTWVPDPGEPPMIYIFGNQWHAAEIMPTLQYRADNVKDSDPIKYMNWPRVTLRPSTENWAVPQGIDVQTLDLSWVPEPGAPVYIYQFGTQWQRTGGPTYTVPGATEIRYEHAPRVIKTSVDPNWYRPDGVAAESFDWTWHPDATDPPFIYQFGTQWQRTGGPQYTVENATEIKFVDQIRVQHTAQATPIVEIDHLDGFAGQIPGTFKRVRYFDNYRDTLIRLAKNLLGEHEFVWVCSSICDYTNFDFSWHPEQWQATMLHVFPSNDQKFGDTFFMHVPTFVARAEKKELLEWYDVNFVEVRVPRRNMPVIVHDADSQVDAVKNTEWAGPLATFTNHDYITGNLATVSLWREKTKTIVPVSTGAGTVVVPRTAVPYIKTQLYDYPYIDKTQRVLSDTPLDIVFISNGEINAGVYLEHLKWTVVSDYKNHIHHVSGVNGRVAAYQEAARQSHTPWFFAVFAKLEVNSNFDWTWQPDRMQQAKHYIFHAHNPVNGLVYGHQAMIAYNKKLVLENTGAGLDFTLDQPHEVVPIVSGTANYHESAWMCWRTAFREVLKLKASLPDVESEHRLNRWLTVDTTPGEWSRKGAEDGVEYYDSVDGEFAALKKSYEWSWLATYAFVKRSLTTDQ
jgi:hypothetical protein